MTGASWKAFGLDVSRTDPVGFHGFAAHELFVVANVAWRGVQILVEHIAMARHARITLLRELSVELTSKHERTRVARPILGEVRIILQVVELRAGPQSEALRPEWVRRILAMSVEDKGLRRAGIAVHVAGFGIATRPA